MLSLQVGNCVGKRNYRFFYLFLVSLAFLAVFIFSCSVTHLVLCEYNGIAIHMRNEWYDLFIPPAVMKKEHEVFNVIKAAPFTVIVVFICFFSIWSVIGLAGFHTYLTTSDQTTNEDVSIQKQIYMIYRFLFQNKQLGIMKVQTFCSKIIRIHS